MEVLASFADPEMEVGKAFVIFSKHIPKWTMFWVECRDVNDPICGPIPVPGNVCDLHFI